jgi:hypothetical protein
MQLKRFSNSHIITSIAYQITIGVNLVAVEHGRAVVCDEEEV